MLEGKIVVSNDHGAVALKKKIVAWLEAQGFEIKDLGVNSETSVDYPDQAREACLEFLKGGYVAGILCCGTGIGISIAANKIQGIRCAIVHDIFTATMAREHNNVNFLAFGGRVKYQVPVEKMLEAFFKTKFEGGRHQRRIDKISRIEKENL